MTAGSAVVVRDAAAIDAASRDGFSRRLLEAEACDKLRGVAGFAAAGACEALLAALLGQLLEAGACEALLAAPLGPAARGHGSQGVAG